MFDVNFISNNINFISINLSEDSPKPFALDYAKTARDYINVYNFYWMDEAYRTITLEEPATGELIEFLEANATKIS